MTTAGVPVRAAAITTVCPSGSTAFASAPLLSSASTIAALPFVAARKSGVTPYRFATLAVGAGADQRGRRLRVVVARRPVQRGRAVDFADVDVGPLIQQRPHRLAVARLDGLDQPGVGAGAGDDGDRGDAEQPDRECKYVRRTGGSLTYGTA